MRCAREEFTFIWGKFIISGMFWSRKQNERRNYKQSFNITYYSPEICAWLLTGSERKGMIKLSYFIAHETDISHGLISMFRSAGTCGGIFKTVNKKSLMLLGNISFHNSCWLFFSLGICISNIETHKYLDQIISFLLVFRF